MSGQDNDARNLHNDVGQDETTDTQQAEEQQAEESSADEAEVLRQQLNEAEAKAADHWDQLLRARAEMDNIRKRAEREVSQARRYGLEGIARELLPIYDSLTLGLAELDKDEASLDTAREGMKLITQMMSKLLDQHSITEIDPAGEPFDPEAHQAMSMHETSEQAPNTVLQVVQKGYRLNDRVLRPAMVVVAKTPAQPADSESGGDSESEEDQGNADS